MEGVIKEFWVGRTAVDDSKAARFHNEHEAYNLAAIGAFCDEHSRVLDLGCGTCIVPNALVESVGCRVHAVDYVPEFLCPRDRRSAADTEPGDVRSYVRDERYDLVLSLGVITYLESPAERRAMYEHCAAMLVPGGTLFLKAQFGVREHVAVDCSPTTWARATATMYPLLRNEVALVSELFDVTVDGPVPGELQPSLEHALPPSRRAAAMMTPCTPKSPSSWSSTTRRLTLHA